MKRLIIYDLDGTLVDTREDIVRAANYMLETMEAKSLRPEEIFGYVGRGLHYLIRCCLKTEDSKTVERGAKRYRDYYAKHMLDHSALYPGAMEVLEYFKGRSQVVLSNKPNPFAEDILRELRIAPYFDVIIAGNSSYPKKPDPGAILDLAKKKDIPLSDGLFVGDSQIDIETGKNAGISTVVLTHGFSTEDELKLANPDAVVSNFYELLELAKQNNW